MTFIEKVAIVIVLPFLLFTAYAMIFWFPVYIYTEAECLAKGYPETRVSIGLERYCVNLDGTITVQVDKQ